MTHALGLTHSVAAASFGILISFSSLAADTNATGLPTYPHHSGGTMDAWVSRPAEATGLS